MTVVDEPNTAELVTVGYAALAATILDEPSPSLPQQWDGMTEDQILDLLDEQAAVEVLAGRNTHTTDAYRDDWKVWVKFTESLGLSPFTVRSGLFHKFVTTLRDTEWKKDTKYAPDTIERRLAGVIVTLRDHGYLIPAKGGVAAQARQEIINLRVDLDKRNEKRGRGKATAITAHQVATICERVPVTLYGLRDKALMLIGLHVAARRSEMSALLVTDVVADPRGRGIEVTIRASKGGQRRVVPVLVGEDPLTCPVLAWQAWLTAAQISDGPAFRRIRPARELTVADAGISPKRAGLIVTGLGTLIGVDLHLTGHSLRATMVTLAFEAGHTVEQVARRSGHSPKSGVIHDYNRPVDAWNNPAARIGV